MSALTDFMRQCHEPQVEELQARIAALEAKLADRVKVKPLEWVEPTGWWNAEAQCVFGLYAVHRYRKDRWTVFLNGDEIKSGILTEAEAKAAAQADFERRILSALGATPPAPKVTEAMVDVLAKSFWGPNWRLTIPEEVVATALTAAQGAPKVTATHRHKKRGTEYVLIGFGKLQAEMWVDWNSEPVDMREVAIYRSVDDGSLWVRPREEFEDGRFEALTAAQEAGKP